MRVALSDEQEMLREAARGVMQRDASLARVREWLDAGDHDTFATLAARQGWTGIGVDEEAGGQGGGVVELAVLFEELGRGAGLSSALLASTGAAAGVLTATAEQEVVAAIAEGERTVVPAWDAGTPVGAASRRAVVADGEALTGELGFVLALDRADDLLVPTESGVFLVPAGADGVSREPRQLLDRAQSGGALSLEGATGRRLSLDDPEATLARAGRRLEALVAADALGAAGRMLELTVEYVCERVQFGVPVGSFQAVKHAAAEMLVCIEAARSAVYHAAWSLDAEQEDAPVHVSVAKAYATEAAVRVADDALTLHGAVGYTWEHDLQLLFKRAKLDRLLFGVPDAHRDRIADGLALVGSQL